MFNKLKHKIGKWLLTSSECNQKTDSEWTQSSKPIRQSKSIVDLNYDIDNNCLESRKLQMTLYYADGGKVLQVTKHNQSDDTWHAELYCIPDTEDLGKTIEDIIIKETLMK